MVWDAPLGWNPPEHGPVQDIIMVMSWGGKTKEYYSGLRMPVNCLTREGHVINDPVGKYRYQENALRSLKREAELLRRNENMTVGQVAERLRKDNKKVYSDLQEAPEKIRVMVSDFLRENKDSKTAKLRVEQFLHEASFFFSAPDTIQGVYDFRLTEMRDQGKSEKKIANFKNRAQSAMNHIAAMLLWEEKHQVKEGGELWKTVPIPTATLLRIDTTKRFVDYLNTTDLSATSKKSYWEVARLFAKYCHGKMWGTAHFDDMKNPWEDELKDKDIVIIPDQDIIDIYEYDNAFMAEIKPWMILFLESGMAYADIEAYSMDQGRAWIDTDRSGQRFFHYKRSKTDELAIFPMSDQFFQVWSELESRIASRDFPSYYKLNSQTIKYCNNIDINPEEFYRRARRTFSTNWTNSGQLDLSLGHDMIIMGHGFSTTNSKHYAMRSLESFKKEMTMLSTYEFALSRIEMGVSGAA